MRTGFPPSAPITQMSNLPPPASESKAIRLPSGDQRGVVTSGPLKEVTWTGLEPSLLHTQISECPERSDTNAILVPSGENCGAESSCVEKMNDRLGNLALAPSRALGPLGAAMRQILLLGKDPFE